MRPLLKLAIRQLAGRRRLGFVLLLGALAVGLAVLIAFLSDEERVHGAMIDVLFDGLMIGAVLPIVTMSLATASFGNALEDKTLSYLVLKPLARWRIALPKILAPLLMGGPLLIVTGVVMTAVLLDGDVRASVAVGVALLAGVVAYTSIFTWAGVVSGSGSSALGFGVVYVFVWEGLIGTFLEGIRYLSVRGYTLGILHWADKESFEEFGERVIEFPAAVAGVAAVAVVFFILTVYQLHRMDVP